jgi:hypothetical protein
MEFTYKLKLPLINEMMVEGFYDKILSDEKLLKQGFIAFDANKILKDNWLLINDYKFEKIFCFYKNNSSGLIHVDYDESENLKEIHEPGFWGINWYFGAETKMEYWLKEDIDYVFKRLDRDAGYHLTCATKKPPNRIYYLNDSEVCLMNASVPHRAKTTDKRFCFSLRSKNLEIWPNVVNKFKHLII